MIADKMTLILGWAGPISTFLVGVPAIYFASKSANQLEILNKLDCAKLTIDSFVKLVGYMTQCDRGVIDRKEVVKFSNFNANVYKYFDKKTAGLIREYYEVCYQCSRKMKLNPECYDEFVELEKKTMPKIKKELKKLPIFVPELLSISSEENLGLYSWFFKKLSNA